MADSRLAAPSKRARRQRATIAFIDECGPRLSPLVRRTLAPRGHTPKLKVRGRHRQKVSIIGALTLSPRRGRIGLYFQTIVNGSFEGESVAKFLQQLLRHIRGRVIVVWDRWSGHGGPYVRAVLARNPRLELIKLPTYAPELNPVEYLWSHLRWSALCNFAPETAAELDAAIGPQLRKAARDQNLLRSFWEGAKLPLLRWRC
jgi:transposase